MVLHIVCSYGGATYIIGEIIAKDNLNIENLMQTFENLLLQTCTFTKWKLILSNNEDNNNNIDINIACSSCSWIAPPIYWWRPPTLVIKLWLKNEIFIFSSSSLKPPADGASYCLFKWWRHLHYWRNNSQRQFEHIKFDANHWKSSSPNMHIHKVKTYHL